MSDEIEWNEDERRALQGLPRESDPGDLLEERTVAALRERGLLRRPSVGAGPDGGRDPRREGARSRTLVGGPAWWAAGIAAAFALFFAGMAAGHAGRAASAEEIVAALAAVEAGERPALVQRTGSLWVESLAGLDELRTRGEDAAVATATEVARGALYAAALELARLHPDDARYVRILEILEGTVRGEPGAGEVGSDVRQVVWF